MAFWHDRIRTDVNDPANLGNCLLQLKRYSEAATAYEMAVNLQRDRPNLQASLGSAYLLFEERDKAASVFRKLADVDPEGQYLNNAAYQIANADLELPVALGYAKSAVQAVEQDS